MEPKSYDSIHDVLDASGLLFESDVIKILKKNKWHCIASRYYLDSYTQKSREIDVVAYKTFQYEINEKTYIITKALIISCKHTYSSEWVFSCEKNSSELNITRNNHHYYSNTLVGRHLYLENMSKMKKRKWLGRNKLLNNKHPLSVHNFIETVKTDDNKWKRNANSKDHNIHSSIDSLVKSVTYEIERLENRHENKKDKYVLYDFSLFSLFDGKINIYDYDTNEIDDSYHNSFTYDNHHIINQNQKAFTISFMNIEQFESKMEIINQSFAMLVKKATFKIEESIEVFLRINNIRKSTYKDSVIFNEVFSNWSLDYNIRNATQNTSKIYDYKMTVFFNEYSNIDGFNVSIVPGNLELYSSEAMKIIETSIDISDFIVEYLKKITINKGTFNYKLKVTFDDLPF